METIKQRHDLKFYEQILNQCDPMGTRGSFPGGKASRPAQESTQPPILWVSGALSLGVKRPGREANHSPPSSAEANE
jgi:hypothetical protein